MSFTQPASKFHDQLLVKQHPFSSTKHHLSSYLLLKKPNHVLAPNLIYSSLLKDLQLTNLLQLDGNKMDLQTTLLFLFLSENLYDYKQ